MDQTAALDMGPVMVRQMDKAKTLDHLFTLRWCLKQNPPKVDAAKNVINLAIKSLMDVASMDPEDDPKDTGTPTESDSIKAKLCVVVGHEEKAPGADFALGGSEYQYNSDIAKRMTEYAARKFPNLEVITIFRDGIGIRGAYRNAANLEPDACIELHFNAYNTHAQGSETLCSIDSEDQKFAGIIQRKICDVFGRPGQSRGVKVLTRGGRGGQSVYSLPGSANCLVEPFFGDNKIEAQLADERRELYAMGLIDGTIEWLKLYGLG